MTDSIIHNFVAEQRELLAAELKAEEESEQEIASSLAKKKSTQSGDDDERASHVVGHLDVSLVSVGLFGRTVVTLATLNDPDRLLPPHRLTTGDEVRIISKSDSSCVGGVISVIDDTSISVALFGKHQETKDVEEDEGETIVGGPPPFTVVPKTSVDVHNKMVRALEELARYGTGHPLAGRVIQAAFSPPDSINITCFPEFEPFNSKLDESQLEAISFSLSDNLAIGLIHGPPGTGKTSTVVELIQQAVHKLHYKVLVTAPSNVAVDNVLDRLVQSQAETQSSKRTKRKNTEKTIRAVRLGHPARIKPSIQPYSLEALVEGADGTEIVVDVKAELNGFLQILLNPRSRASDKWAARREIKNLRKEVRLRETKVVEHLIKDAQVVLATNVGAANAVLDGIVFDLIVIDEAAQSLEAASWIPMLKGKRLVLAGDHKQLPPTIKNRDRKIQRLLSKTLFERLMETYALAEKTHLVSRMLRIQYRMHQDIASWASQAMYDGELQTHESVKEHLLSDLPNFSSRQPPLLLIDTAGCGMDESVNGSGSRFNEGEAEVVVQHVTALIHSGLKADSIAVISPYNGQVELLRILLSEQSKLEIRSVDGFQGGERVKFLCLLISCAIIV
jgi:superfamily I DNA and/or RNA helicase